MVRIPDRIIVDQLTPSQSRNDPSIGSPNVGFPLFGLGGVCDSWCHGRSGLWIGQAIKIRRPARHL